MAIVNALVRAIHHTVRIIAMVLLTVTIFEYSKQYLMNKYLSMAIASMEYIEAVKGTNTIASCVLQV